MKYQANPVIVDAFKIVGIAPNDENGNTPLHLEDGEFQVVTPAMTTRMALNIGDYVVIQSDGYIYLNPKDVFERNYGPVQHQPGT